MSYKVWIIAILLLLPLWCSGTIFPTICLEFVLRGGSTTFNGGLIVDLDSVAAWIGSVAVAGVPINNGPVTPGCQQALEELAVNPVAPTPCRNFPMVNSTSFCFTDPVSGNDANPCTDALPCATVSGAISAGCVRLAMRGGTYSGALNRNLNAAQLRHIHGLGHVEIDLQNAGRFIRFDDSVSSEACSLFNVTIRNGAVDAPTRAGAVRVQDVPITIVKI